MSLYNHVANKDDVLDGMLDLVLAECKPPSPVGDWAATAIRNSAISVHEALRRHPWACNLLIAPGRIRPAHAYRVLDGYIFGFSHWETSHTYTAEEVSRFAAIFAEMITPDTYPYLHEHAQQHFSDGPHRERVRVRARSDRRRAEDDSRLRFRA